MFINNLIVLLSWISLPSTFWLPKAFLFSLLAKAGGLVTPSCHVLSWLPASRASWQEDNTKRNRDSLCPLRTRAPLIGKEGPSLSFGSCQLLLQPLPPQLSGCLGARTRENGLWEFPFCSWACSGGRLLEPTLFVSCSAWFWVSGSIAFNLEIPRGEKMVMQVIFDPSATICSSESSYSTACTVSRFYIEVSGRDLELKTLMKDFKQGNNMVWVAFYSFVFKAYF